MESANGNTLTSPLSVDSIEPTLPGSSRAGAATTSSLSLQSSPSPGGSLSQYSNQRWIKWTIWISYFDIITLPRYIILPSVLLSCIGGPKFIFFIWPLVTFFTFLTYTFLYLHGNTLPHSSLITSWKKSFLTQKVTFHLLWIWSIIDLLFSAASFFFAFILAIFVALDSDGTIVNGWKSLYIAMIFECIFCAFSIVFRILITITSMCLVCNKQLADNVALPQQNNDIDHHLDDLSQTTHTTEESTRQLSPVVVKLTTYLPFVFLGLSCFFVLLSLVFVSLCLQDYMKSTYYLTDTTTDTNNKGCDPMVRHTCLLPYPSSYYLETSQSTASGYQVAIPPSALPFSKRGVQITAKYSANRYDGFAVGSMIVWALDHSQSLDNSQLVSSEDIDLSTHLNSTTLLINSITGELHSHFAEKDFIDYDNDHMGYMMPTPSLYFNTSYIAIVKGLRNKHQEYLRPSDLTKQYLDAYIASPTTIPLSLQGDTRYIRFQTKYFPLMEQIGMNLTNPSDPIQIIWDFHTATYDSLTYDLTLAKNKTHEVIEKKLSQQKKLFEEIQEVHDNSCEGNGKMSKIDYYKIKTPWYMKNHQRQKNSIQRKSLEDSSDHVEITEYPGLLLQIPCSVTKGKLPATALVEVGHGIFWDRTFALGQWIRQQAGQEGWILWSMDWRGATKNDVPQFIRLLSHDFAKGINFLQSSVIQGYSDKIAGSMIVRDILQRKYSHFFTTSIYTPATIPGRFIGMSLGSILGGGWVAYSQIHDRAVLLAGGSSFSFLIGRSDLFWALMLLCDFQFYSRTDLRLALQLAQSSIDSLESTGWTHTGRFKNLQILVENGLGDATVTPISGRILARNLNASIVTPTIPPEGNLIEIPSPVFNASHLYFQVEYAKEYDTISSKSKPSDSNSVHSCFPTRNEITSASQEFLANGSFSNPCGTSACVYKNWVHCD